MTVWRIKPERWNEVEVGASGAAVDLYVTDGQHVCTCGEEGSGVSMTADQAEQVAEALRAAATTARAHPVYGMSDDEAYAYAMRRHSNATNAQRHADDEDA